MTPELGPMDAALVAEIARHRVQLTLTPLDAALVSAGLRLLLASRVGDLGGAAEVLRHLEDGVQAFGPVSADDPQNWVVATERASCIAMDLGLWLVPVSIAANAAAPK